MIDFSHEPSPLFASFLEYIRFGGAFVASGENGIIAA